MRRPTIHDIARRAGVAKSTVSFALNGRPGVSEATRLRILGVADELGWQPSRAARALSGAQAETVGLVLASKAVEPYFLRLIAGFEAALGTGDVGLLLQVVGEDPARELEVYRRWWGQRRVDGVFLVDVRIDDPRLPLLRRLGLPAVALDRCSTTSVWIDADTAMRTAVGHLARLGHRRIAMVTGIMDFVQTRERTEAFLDAARAMAMESAVCVHADWSGEQGARATRKLLTAVDRPTAIVYDNDVMAVSAVGVANELGVDVPGELSIIAWEDSPLCLLPHPPLTAMRLDFTRYGEVAGEALRRVIAGESVPDVAFGTPELVERGSTGPC